MKDYGEFHDGSFDGFWVYGDTVHVFLRTWDKRQFTAVVTGVTALSATGFRAGSIILSVETRDRQEIDLDDMAELYDLPEGAAGAAQAARHLAKAREENLMVLAISPSYGADCLVLAHSMELLERAEWIRRYCHNENA